MHLIESELKPLKGLLAILNADGGHRQAEVGVATAVEEAIEKYHGLHHEIDKLKAELQRRDLWSRPERWQDIFTFRGKLIKIEGEDKAIVDQARTILSKKTRMLSKKENKMPPLKITVEETEAMSEPHLMAYTIELRSPESVWRNRFGSKFEVELFINGVMAAAAMYGNFLERPEGY